MSKLRFTLTFLGLFAFFFSVFHYGDYFLNSHVYFRIFDFNTHHCKSSINCISSYLFSGTQEGHMFVFFIISRILRFFDASHGLLITQLMHSFFVAVFFTFISYLLRFKGLKPWWLLLTLLLFPEFNQMVFTAEDNIVFYGFLLGFLAMLYFPDIFEEEERLKDKHFITGALFATAMFFHASTLIYLPLMGIPIYRYWVLKEKPIRFIYYWPVVTIGLYFLLHCLFSVDWTLQGILKAPVITVISSVLGFGSMTIGTAAMAKQQTADLSYFSQVQGALGGMLLPDQAPLLWKFVTVLLFVAFLSYLIWILYKKYTDRERFRFDYWISAVIISILMALIYEPAEAERWDFLILNILLALIFLGSRIKEKREVIFVSIFLLVQVTNSLLTYNQLNTLYKKETQALFKARSDIRSIPKNTYRKYIFPLSSAPMGAYIASHFPLQEKEIYYVDLKNQRIYQNLSATLTNRINRWDQIFKSQFCVFCFYKKNPEKSYIEAPNYFEVMTEKNIFIHPEVQAALTQMKRP